MRSILITIFLISCIPSLAQRIGSAKDINTKLLEHLVKTKVDSVRTQNDCKPLANDSILYVAAQFHANYMSSHKKLSHNESNNDSMRTPQDRVLSFGGKQYLVGENINYVPINSEVHNKSKKIFKTDNLQSLSDAIVDTWVHSPPHFENIKTEEYQITGVSISIDTIKNRVYSCQKFAKVPYQYSFEENKEFFKYSEYTAPDPITSFDGMEKKLQKGNYPYKLKHNRPNECKECDAILKDSPFLSLRIEGKNFILRVENADIVKQLIDNPGDGFAVEIVEFKDYMCGNPEYYTKPSRRNEQSKLNGRILHPLYKAELHRGYKKRKKKEDINFLSYIFKNDSVKFFKKFGRYSLDKYSHDYFEIKLGKIPKDVDGLFAHNLVNIQNKQICKTLFFTSYCGELYQDYIPPTFMAMDTAGNYTLVPAKKELNFTVPFSQGKSEFSQADIQPFIDNLTNVDYSIDSISIEAFASIEGDSLGNLNLQKKRAQSIVKVLESNSQSKGKVHISTATDWDGFRFEASQSDKFKELANATNLTLQEEIKAIPKEELEPLLTPSRRAEISMHITVEATGKNAPFVIKSEFNQLQRNVINSKSKPEKQQEFISRLNELYSFTHKEVKKGKIPPKTLASLIFKEEVLTMSYSLLEKHILFGYEYEEEFRIHNSKWKSLYSTWSQKAEKEHPEKLSPLFMYNSARLEFLDFKGLTKLKLERVQNIINKLEELKAFYNENPVAQANIDKINYDLNIILINKTYSHDRLKYSEDAIQSLAQIFEYQQKNDILTPSSSMKLGRCAVEFRRIEFAYQLLAPFANEDSVKAFTYQIAYNHKSTPGSEIYYQQLIDIKKEMNQEVWCNMFMGECKIPFQAFDHEELRNTFCESCLDKNKKILELLDSN